MDVPALTCNSLPSGAKKFCNKHIHAVVDRLRRKEINSVVNSTNLDQRLSTDKFVQNIIIHRLYGH